MADDYVKDEDKMLAGAAYAVGIPSLYIILTEKRKEKFTGFHGTQALFYWVAFIVFWVAARVLRDFIWSFAYLPFLDSLISLIGLILWLYALYCGYRAYIGEYFKVPYISDFIQKNEL
jgi:uncharacterized membrane protein